MDKQVSGIRVAPNAPTISHLFFADDSLLFCRANLGEAQKVKEILETCAAASDQVLNTDKSSVFFSKNAPKSVKIAIINQLGGMKCEKQSKYLGLPMLIGKTKCQIFRYIKERIRKKLGG